MGNILQKQIVNVMTVNDLVNYTTKEQISKLDKNHIVVPMNGYYISDIKSNDIITTTGFIDCVVFILYNPRYGRYFGHFLKFNDFFEDFSNACEFLTNKKISESDCAEASKYEKVCIIDTLKIYKSLPEWTNQSDTIAYIYNQGESYKTISRFLQLLKVGFKGQINLFIKDAPSDEIEYIKKIKNITTNIITNSDSFVMTNILGILPNGEIFKLHRDSLENYLPKLYNFYKSITINRITSNIKNNKRCIANFYINLNHYETNKTEYERIEKINNYPIKDGYTPYLLALNEFLSKKN